MNKYSQIYTNIFVGTMIWAKAGGQNRYREAMADTGIFCGPVHVYWRTEAEEAALSI